MKSNECIPPKLILDDSLTNNITNDINNLTHDINNLTNEITKEINNNDSILSDSAVANIDTEYKNAKVLEEEVEDSPIDNIMDTPCANDQVTCCAHKILESQKIEEVGGNDISRGEETINIVGVELDLTGKIYDYLQNNVELRHGDYCIAEMDKGVEIARICCSTRAVSKKQYRKPLKKILRKATLEDIEQNNRNEEKGDKALSICQKKMLERGLPMKLVKVKYSFDGSKAVFYFTAEGRVDFRDLVKDLAARFKTRIEMRQIGVRDEARIIMGYGSCGRPLCCALFLRDFEPVSIRMAKDQCLTLNPGKISGTCGRLMCCLVYEADHYEEMRKSLPKLGERVMVKNEEGKVVSFDVLKQLVLVEFADGRVLKVNGTDIQRIKGDSSKKSQKKPSKPEKEKSEPENQVTKPGKLPKG